MNLLELFYRRAQAQLAANALLDAALSESRDLTANEQYDFDRHVAQVAELDSKIEERAALAA